ATPHWHPFVEVIRWRFVATSSRSRKAPFRFDRISRYVFVLRTRMPVFFWSSATAGGFGFGLGFGFAAALCPATTAAVTSTPRRTTVPASAPRFARRLTDDAA